MRRKRHGATPVEIERIYRARLADFRRVAAAITGDAESGSDAVQEAFGTALRKRRSYRGDGSLEAWLWRLVVNRARDESRALQRGPRSVGQIAELSNGSAPMEDSRLAIAITLLPERQRLAVFLRYYADLDYASIATALGIKAGTVAAALNAAHQSLRGALEEAVK